MIFDEGSRVIVNEAYVGRTPEIQKMYNDFCEIRHKYIGTNKIPNHKECTIIENHIEKIFGFKAVQWNVTIDDSINACTYPVCTDIFIDTSTMFVTTKNGGYKYTKDAKAVMLCAITRGAFNNDSLTDGECFSLLLHEIGHSFVTRGSGITEYIMMSNFLVIYTVILSLVTCNIIGIKDGLKRIALSSSLGKEAGLNIDKAVRNSFLRIFKNSASEIFNMAIKIFSSILYVCTFPAQLTLAIPRKILGKCVSFLYKLLGGSTDRSIEYLSDDFATVYGFGPEMASANKKLGTYKLDKSNIIKNYALNNNGVIGWTANFINDCNMELMYAIDVRPTPDKRIQAIRRSLIDELEKNKDLSPKVKEELKDNIVKLANMSEDISKKNEFIYANKDEAIIAVKELINQSGDKYDPDWAERTNLDKNYINQDYKDRLID